MKSIRLFFWQNMPNIHEAGYIKYLSENGFNCTVLFQIDLSVDRLKLGVQLPDYGDAIKIFCKKWSDIPPRILNGEDGDFHFMTGILAFDLNKRAFDILKFTKSKIFLISESRDSRGIKGKLRYWSSLLREREIRKRIDGVFAMGYLGVKWFLRTKYPKAKVFPFCYAVNKGNFSVDKKNRLPNIAFVGQFIDRKNPLFLIEALRGVKISVECHFFGDGPLLGKMKAATESDENLVKYSFHGSMPNNILVSYFSSIDILILPSRWDGWGAVVNEALSMGCKCIVSDHCGAASAICEDVGSIFKANSLIDLTNMINKELFECPLNIGRRKNIKDWSDNFSGENIAKYMLCKVGLGDFDNMINVPFVQ